MTVTCYFHVPLLVDIPDALNNTFNQALTEGKPWAKSDPISQCRLSVVVSEAV